MERLAARQRSERSVGGMPRNQARKGAGNCGGKRPGRAGIRSLRKGAARSGLTRGETLGQPVQ